MTMRMRYLYRNRGDHISMRSAHEYVVDQRDLDADGKPPKIFLPFVKIEKEPEEIEFDHPATEDELRKAFAKRKTKPDDKP